mmetsp:Transcript_5135/g.12726  ORF Transcript_5135/g.12726 Transcript_5135/m.12726 type:complete len:236 (-) Transcript_5135:2663-3370(-)
MDLVLHHIRLLESIHAQLVPVGRLGRQHQDHLGGWNLAHQQPLHHAVGIQGPPVDHRIAQRIPDQGLDKRPAFNQFLLDLGIRRRHSPVDTPEVLGDIFNPTGADLEGVQGIILQTGTDDQIIVGHQRLLDVALAGGHNVDVLPLPIDINHSSVQHPHPQLQHHPPQLVMGVGRGAGHKREVVGVAVLEPSRGKEGQRAEMHVRDAQEGLQEGEPGVGCSDDHDTSVHLDLMLAE